MRASHGSVFYFLGNRDEREIENRVSEHSHQRQPQNQTNKKGGAGFIASHVVSLLVHRYPSMRVIVLDKLDYCASLRNLRSVADAPNFKFVKGDICSGDLVSYLLETEKVDTVMHFAAQTHVDNSFGNSLAFTLNNTYGARARGFLFRLFEFVKGKKGSRGSKTPFFPSLRRIFDFSSLFLPKYYYDDNRNTCRPGGVQGGRGRRERAAGAAGEEWKSFFFFHSFSFFRVQGREGRRKSKLDTNSTLCPSLALALSLSLWNS